MTSPELFDVIVIGGGAAGVGAAVGAAQAGARTLLVESGPCLGGAATQKNVLTYCGLYTQGTPAYQAVGGVGEQVLAHLRQVGGIQAPIRISEPSNAVIALIDPEAVKLALDQVVQIPNLDVLLHTMLVGAERVGECLHSVTLQDDRGPRQVVGRAFVDASGEGDLAAFGGASVRYGNHNVAQAGTLGVRFGGIRPGADQSSKRWAQAIREAKQQGNSLLTKEDGLVLPIPVSGDLMTYLIDATYDALDSASITQAEMAGRARAWAYLAAIKTIPGYEQAYIVSTGPKFGTRESRHVNGHYQVTEADVTSGARHADVIALGAWPIEYHPEGDKPVVWKEIKDDGTFDIPLRALTSENTPNLYAAGRLVDGDGGGGSALRVMGTSFATGQAAGVAAALLARGSHEIAAIQAELERQGARLRAGQLEVVATEALA
ncbi:FAD-dependent oxidoreductase [uncultured Hymenobacter sp.]|uniref:FAD-dependent oxidoreductase n=1 Tax=uncultured Hymenobacter sp. TaxID=170016 RepID=UPI0035CA6168